MQLKRLAQNIILFLGLIGKVITNTPEFNTLWSNGVNRIMIILDELFSMESQRLGLLQRFL